MSREKNIGEMTDVLKRIFGGSFAYKIEYGKYSGYEGHKEVYTRDIAAELTDKGYRKATEVAREIFEDIDDIFIMLKPQYFVDAPHLSYKRVLDEISKLKKKYESEKDNECSKKML